MSDLIIPRRRFLIGALSLLAAPAIVKVTNLMPVKVWRPRPLYLGLWDVPVMNPVGEFVAEVKGPLAPGELLFLNPETGRLAKARDRSCEADFPIAVALGREIAACEGDTVRVTFCYRDLALITSPVALDELRRRSTPLS